MTDWLEVPAGQFPFAMHPAADFPPDVDETPLRIVPVAAFRIGRVPVTNAQYQKAQYHSVGDERPVTYVSLAEAEAFCDAAGVRLPSEVEWEAAARGGDDRLWPWGDELPDHTRATFAMGIGEPAPVGLHPAGAAPCGALDMAGNVYEWTSSGVVRGGSYLSGPNDLRCSARMPMHRETRDPYVGFRVVAVDPHADFDWVDVPAAEYAIGRDPGVHRLVEVDTFELARTPVTNAEYAVFVADGGAAAPAHWPAPDDHPVTFVDWFGASAYCAWAGGRLPTEIEWEKAAAGTDGRRYPWGDDEDTSRAAIGSGLKEGSTRPVGSHPTGASPYGLEDMAGNVWEWTSTEFAGGERVVRGGSYASPGLAWARCAMRSHSRPQRRQSHIGFRVARGVDDAR
jgi:formylglycine-generating enzyme required for sulfatase activity